MAYSIKRHDTSPALIATLRAGKGKLDLGGALGVKFIMRDATNPNRPPKVSAAATILQSGTENVGQVRYDWAVGDTDTAGVYNAEWEIDFGSAGRQTVPNDSYFQVVILGDLG